MTDLGERSRTPLDVARLVKYLCRSGNGVKPRLTFLLGAGFSASAGIPTAAGIVKRQLEIHPLLADAPPCPLVTSVYSHLMGLLPAVERMRVVREAIGSACAADTGQPKINWAHLLLATLVEAGYVKRILTTNFDPLAVDALALMGLPVRAFDLSASAHFVSGMLRTGSIVYLHGQSHGLLLSNTIEELATIRVHVREVLQDALSDSTLVIVGYSGACDPVFEELRDTYRQFPYQAFWVHYDPQGSPPGEAVKAFIASPAREVFLVTGHDADAFMRALVVDGLGLTVPTLVTKPLEHLRTALGRITRYPDLPDAPPTPDPVEAALKMVEAASQALAESSAQRPPADLKLRIALAALSGDLEELRAFDPLVRDGEPDLRAALADAYLKVAETALERDDTQHAGQALRAADTLGVANPWLPATWAQLFRNKALREKPPTADALFAQAGSMLDETLRLKPDFHEALHNWGLLLQEQAETKVGDEAARLYRRAAEKYAEALSLKPDKHETLNNWGLLLVKVAGTKTGDEADRLYQQAAEKYAEALRLKPGEHKVLYNWGLALAKQARTKTRDEADTLYQQAAEKFSESLRLKPDMHEALNSWGLVLMDLARTRAGDEAEKLYEQAVGKFAAALRIKPEYPSALYNYACMFALRKQPAEVVASLRRWSQAHAAAQRSKIDADTDFDAVRGDPAFQAFLDTLPE